MLLAIDTSTHYASVAIHDRSRLLAEYSWLTNQDHTRTLLPAVRRLLVDSGTTLADVSVVAVALGPGSFNGLRVGLSTAKALALARAVPLVGVPTLELLAAEYGLEVVTMNAGRGQMYRWQGPSPDIDIVEGVPPDRVRHAGVLAELGWLRLQAGRALPPAQAQPVYVRPPQITESRVKTHMLEPWAGAEPSAPAGAAASPC